MLRLIQVAAETLAVWIAGSAVFWLGSVLLLRRLPRGRLRRLAEVGPDAFNTTRRLLRDTRTPWRARAVLAAGLFYFASPVTLIPDFIPVLGKIDNVLAIALAVRLARALTPREALGPAQTG